MITRFATYLRRQRSALSGQPRALQSMRWAPGHRLAALALLIAVAGCGGGGGGAGGFKGDSDSDVDTYFLQVALLDQSGNPATVLTSTDALIVQATVTRNNRNGEPIANERVTATTDIGTLDPASGSVLTNGDGVASMQLLSTGVLGAGTVSIFVTDPSGIDITASLNYQVEFADLQIGYFDGGMFIPGEIGLSAPAIPSSGSLLLTINVVDAMGQPVTTTETITFESTCSRSGQATIESPVDTVNGLATSNYVASGCGGGDEITATLQGVGTTASAGIGIADPAAGSINFVAAVPPSIALEGTGGPGRAEDSLVTFQVVDSFGVPVANEPVRFALSSTIGGATLSNSVSVTNAEGQASVTVNSGSIPAPIRVTAAIDIEDSSGALVEVFSISDELIITSGLPDQNSISLSAERLSARGGRNIDGVQVQFTVRMADRFNNPVPDGTAATFRTEYGSIGGGCTTAGGSCSVTWESQSPRIPSSGTGDLSTTAPGGYSCPSHNGSGGPCPDDIRSGDETAAMISRVTVVAQGEEVFIDRNANGIMDEEESSGDFFPLSLNLPEAFVDYNDDGAYTPGGRGVCPTPVSLSNCTAAGFEEEYFDFNNNGVYDFNDRPPVYNGKLCPLEGDGIWCSRELVNVFDSQNILLSSGIGFEFNLTSVNSGRNRISSQIEEGLSYILYIADEFNNPPVAGDSVSVEGVNGCSIISDTGFEPFDTNRAGAYQLPILVEGDGNEENDTPTVTGAVQVTVESAFGITQISYPCITFGEPAEEPDPVPPVT